MILLIAISALAFTAWRVYQEHKLRLPRYESDKEYWQKVERNKNSSIK